MQSILLNKKGGGLLQSKAYAMNFSLQNVIKTVNEMWKAHSYNSIHMIYHMMKLFTLGYPVIFSLAPPFNHHEQILFPLPRQQGTVPEDLGLL